MPIVLRRVAAGLLIPAFALLLTGALLLLRVNATFLDPAVYTETLDRIDAYDFLYDAALPAFFEESGSDLEERRLTWHRLSNDKVIERTREVFPPEFLRMAVGEVVNEAAPYLAGRADSFAVHIPLDERAHAAEDVARGILEESDLYDFLFAEVVEPEVRHAAETYFDGLPFDLAPTNEEVVAGLREIVPRDWFDRQLGAAFDQAAPYLTGRAESFSILISLQERTGAAQAVFARWLVEKWSGGFLERTIVSWVEDAIGGQDVLPWGLRFSSEEAAEVVRAILASPWADAAASADAVAAYVAGRSDDLTVSIPTEGGVDAAAKLFGGMADAKLRAFYNRLPRCSLSAPVPDFSLSVAPECRPPLFTYAAAKTVTGHDPVRIVEEILADAAPASITLTRSDLLGAAADDPALDTVRGYLRDGYAFSDQDLRALLVDEVGSDAVDGLDTVREWFADGIRFDSADLRDAVGAGSVEGVRAILGTAAALPPFLIAAALLLLLAAGFLGGRGWPDRLIWAGAALVIAGALIILSASVSAGLAANFADEAMRELDLNQAVVAKAEEALDEAARVYAGPLRVQGVVVLAAGVAMAVAGGGLAYALAARPR